MNNWDGNERRKINNEDHDILLTVANDVKHMVDWTKHHTQDDDNRHQENLVKFEKIDKTVGFQQKIIYGAIGAIALIEFAVKFIK